MVGVGVVAAGGILEIFLDFSFSIAGSVLVVAAVGGVAGAIDPRLSWFAKERKREQKELEDKLMDAGSRLLMLSSPCDELLLRHKPPSFCEHSFSLSLSLSHTHTHTHKHLGSCVFLICLCVYLCKDSIFMCI
ncbi:hypothetical protein Pfo_011903 [Paulownia fortunei]|nr:hypothetical protein Pfo_011903 [Paulownia fortunei]